MLSDRTFGVEIECGHPLNDYDMEHALAVAGVPVDYVDYDGTDLEIPTPILRGESGMQTLKTMFKVIVDTGGYISNADGMHVHHGATDYTIPDLKRLVHSWVNMENVFEAFVSEYRRGGYHACPKGWNKDNYKTLKTGEESYWHRPNLNIAGITEYLRYEGEVDGKPTVEFRLHEGCLDYEVARAWILLGQRFIDKVKNEGILFRTCVKPITLLQRLEIPSTEKEILLEKVANPAVPEERRCGEWCDCDECYYDNRDEPW